MTTAVEPIDEDAASREEAYRAFDELYASNFDEQAELTTIVDEIAAFVRRDDPLGPTDPDSTAPWPLRLFALAARHREAMISAHKWACEIRRPGKRRAARFAASLSTTERFPDSETARTLQAACDIMGSNGVPDGARPHVRTLMLGELVVALGMDADDLASYQLANDHMERLFAVCVSIEGTPHGRKMSFGFHLMTLYSCPAMDLIRSIPVTIHWNDTVLAALTARTVDGGNDRLVA